MASSLKLKPPLINFYSSSCQSPPSEEQSVRMRVLLLPTSMPLTVHLWLLVTSLILLLLCSSTSCLGTQYEVCVSDGSIHCGDIVFGYPFGEKSSGCGDTDFQLDCPQDDPGPLLNISGNEYFILKTSSLVENGNHRMKIVNNHILSWEKNLCDLPAINNDSFWNASPLFNLADGYSIVTFWQDCHNSPGLDKLNSLPCVDSWYYSWGSELESRGTRSCETHFQLPIQNADLQSKQFSLVEGFEITWYDDLRKKQTCGDCFESKGYCGYDSSQQFVCYCRDETERPDKCPGNGGRNMSIIIGCSIGGAALVAMVVVLFLRLYVKRRKQPPPPPPRSAISKVEKFLREYAYEMPTRYSKSDLKKMTNNFAEKLGEGGYGVVYKGKLRNGVLVAVKLLDRHRHTQTQFMNEVATIGRIHHVNLVRLMGYCFESFASALVYEYMVNGSLEKFIFAGKEKGQVLRWEKLYSIALGAARGIAYLHQDCEKRIIHFDIKPHNILLDSEFTAKVSDFGLAKLCGKGDDHISVTGARGTPGYVAPEVWSRDLGPVTDKSDVYSFGMLLLEIVGGRKNIDVRVSRSSQFYFPEWAFKLLESGELGMRLRGGGEMMGVEDEEKARRLTKVGLWCIQYNHGDRPCMSRVVQMLQGNGDDVSNPPLPFNTSAEPENPLPFSVGTSSTEIRL